MKGFGIATKTFAKLLQEFMLRWWFYYTKIINYTINWIAVFEKLLCIPIRHVYIFNSQESHWYSPIVFDQLLGQSRALTLLKLCVMFKDHMIQDHNLGANSHRSTVSKPQARKTSREFTPGNIRYRVWIVWRDNNRAIPAVRFVISSPGHKCYSGYSNVASRCKSTW